MDRELEARLRAWLGGPTKDFDKIWQLLAEAGERKLELSFDQDGQRRAIFLVQGRQSVNRARALLEDL